MTSTDRSLTRVAPARRFDVFLSHNWREKPVVERIAVRLKEAGVEPWLDTWHLTPGTAWIPALHEALLTSRACAVCVGPAGLGDWVREEMAVALERAVKDPNFRVFLVLLPGLPDPFDPGELPAFLITRTWVDLRRGANSPRELQALINTIRGVPLEPFARSAIETAVCPYRGLQTFDEQHAEFFYGRDADIQRLVERLKEHRFLAVLGPSGVGKSSVVRAGLVPALRAGRLPGSADWPIIVVKPGARPLTELAVQLAELDPRRSRAALLDELAGDRRALDLAVAGRLVQAEPTARLVWIVDQFEEVFTLCHDETERGGFIDNLLHATTAPGGRSVVILTMRADFYPRCATYPALAALVGGQQYLVSALDRDGLRQAIEQPARQVGLEFEPGLVETLLDDVANRSGSLPLLEHSLLELWERRRDSMLTLEAYRQSGGVTGAIAQRAEAIYADLDAAEQEAVRRILLRLTVPGDGAEDTRRRASLGELDALDGTGSAVNVVLQALVAARLLTVSASEATGERQVDVAHEALIRAWPRLRAWVDEDRTGLREHRRLTETAQEWQRLGRDEGLLYRGARLATASEWRARNEAALNPLEREFLDASVEVRDRERLAARRRVRNSIAALAIGVLILGAATVFSVLQWNSAVEEADARATAETDAVAEAEQRATAQAQADSARVAAEESQRLAYSRELAARSLTQMDVDAQLSLLLAREAVRVLQTQQAVEVLRRVLLETPYLEMSGDDTRATAASLSPDGSRVAVGSFDGSLAVWDVASRDVAWRIAGDGQLIRSVAFSHDGSLLVSGSFGEVTIRDATSGSRLIDLRGHTGEVLHAAFSRDDSLLLTVGEDGTARVWDSATGEQLAMIERETRIVVARFFPDGERVVVAADDDPVAVICDARSGAVLAELNRHVAELISIGFSPDGRYLVTTSYDGTAWTWDADSYAARQRLEPNAYSIVIGAAFSPDSRSLVVTGTEGLVVTLDLDSGLPIAEYRGHHQAVLDVEFDATGTLMVTGSVDGTARLWDVASQISLAELRGHVSAVESATFSSQGNYILTSSFLGEAEFLYSYEALGATLTELLAQAEARLTRGFTAEERATYLHE